MSDKKPKPTKAPKKGTPRPPEKPDKKSKSKGSKKSKSPSTERWDKEAKTTKDQNKTTSPSPQRPDKNAKTTKDDKKGASRSPTPDKKAKATEKPAKSPPTSPTSSKKEKLTEEQIDVLREVFNSFDHKGNGEITSKELGMVLKALGMDFSDTELMDLISEIDTDGSGTIDFKEFQAMMLRKMKQAKAIKPRKEGRLKEAFHIFDKNGDGFITAPEIRLVMESLGERVTKEDVDAMMKWADKNGDGRINYDEFKEFMKTWGKEYA